MKKVLLVLVITLLLTGCTVVKIDTNDIENIYSVVLSKKNKLYNKVGKGYKYYIPKSVTYIDTNDFNDRLYSNGSYYYLYLDVINYYYSTNVDYKEDNSLYYSKIIDINSIKGYLEITEKDNKYLVKYYYNYALFTALVDENDLNSVVLDASYILSTVKYNKNILALSMDEDYFTNREQKYEEFINTKQNDDFLLAPDEQIKE